MRNSEPCLTVLLASSLLALQACVSVPERGDVTASEALQPAEGGALLESSQRIRANLGQNGEPGESAFWLLDRADFSLEARLALVDRAVKSLDIQYFIWEKDPSSRLYSHRVLLAADRGVRVRILLDDLTLNGQDGEFFALDKHPNIEVRTFNPWKARRNIGRVAEFLVRFRVLNRRMHNKIIVADGHFAIVGGRNIGDRYFGLWEEFVQNDLDVLAAGRIVGDVARGFDDYWNSALSYPLDRVISKRAQAAELDEMREFIESFYRAESRKLNYFPLEPVSWKSFLEAIEESAAPGSGRLVQDLPSVQHDRPVQLVEPLNEFVGRAEKRVLVSSPYLIPDDEFFAILEALEARGVEVVILTNSLASNNHMIAHAAYMPWRKRFLRAGMDLFESRDDSPMIEYYSTPPVEPAFLGLHSKAIVVDDRYSYIGSANIDPRSLIMNTELAMFMDSPELATRLTELIERDLSPEAAWRVTLNDRGKLRWTSSAGTVSKQPALGFGQRLAHFFIRMLPIRSQA